MTTRPQSTQKPPKQPRALYTVRMRFLILLSAGIVFLGFPTSSSAQFSPFSGEPFTLSVSPQYPLPYGEATVTPISGVLDLSDAVVTAFVNGTAVALSNTRTVTVPLGAAGKAVSVRIVATAGGTRYEKTVVIRPQDVVLVAEPLGTVPPLYAGKASIVSDGEVRLVAIANLVNGTVPLAPTALSYRWSIDGSLLAGASGVGKSSVTVAAPLPYRTRTVTVSVQNQDGSVTGGASLPLKTTEPLVRIYKKDPLLGIRFDEAVTGEVPLEEAEVSFYGVPYSFPLAGEVPSLSWTLNGSTAKEGSTITLRPSGEGRGTATIGFEAVSGLLRANSRFSLVFGSAPRFGVFGL